jgi:hypothetical protein
MNKQTFEKSSDAKYRKEEIEWLRIWCEDTHKDLPRVALIGDSITEQVFEGVKKELQGVALVDYLATSYSITSPAYIGMLEKFVEDSDYAVVYYNYGLHASNVTLEEYEEVYRGMLVKFLKQSKVLLGSTTVVHDKDHMGQELPGFVELVRGRNARAKMIAEEFGVEMDNSFEISVELGVNGKADDCIHFNEMGKATLAKHKAEWIKKLLK